MGNFPEQINPAGFVGAGEGSKRDQVGVVLFGILRCDAMQRRRLCAKFFLAIGPRYKGYQGNGKGDGQQT